MDLVEAQPDLVDYLEMPFEQLRHAPALLATQDRAPLILHCASLSVAGFVNTPDAVVEAIARTCALTETPWLGEHLAFISAEALDADIDPGAAPTQLTYTVSPAYNEAVLERVADNLRRYSARLDVPIILENPPLYFAAPGSTMGQADFIRELASATGVGLILDLSHLMISAYNMGAEAESEVDRLPLENVVEVHMSGHSLQSGVMWDDHAVTAPESEFRLLDRVLDRVRPEAVTLEYNWDAFPPAVVRKHLARVHDLVAR